MSWRRHSLLSGLTEIVVRKDGIEITPDEFNQLVPSARAQLLSIISTTNPPTALPSVKSALIISEVIQKYYDEKMTAKSWTSKSSGEILSSLNLLVEVLGDIPATEVDVDKAGKVFHAVSILPSGWKKKPAFRDKTVEQLLKNPPQGTLAVSTVNKNMDRISSLWAWAVEKEYVSKQLFKRLRQKDDSQPDEGRALFQTHELKQIFQSDIFKANAVEKPFHYWTPLVALLSGMRQTEIGQLYLDDIRLEAGIWVFDVNKNNPDQKLKNKFSKRLVPIHSSILKAGIIQYRDKLKQEGHSRLFPGLNFSTKNGYGDDISDWFGKYRISVGIPVAGPTFHSFRHTLASALMNESVPEAITAKILGHAHKKITYGTYGKKPIDVLQETIERLDFDGVLADIIPWDATTPKVKSRSRKSLATTVKPSVEVQPSDTTARIFSKSLEAAGRN